MRYLRSRSRSIRPSKRIEGIPRLGKCILAGIFAAEFILAFALGRYSARAKSASNEGPSSRPAIAPLPVSSPAEPSKATQNAEREDAQFLILVNWEHPISAERPEDLVRLDSVFGDEVMLVNPEGSIQKDAAAAAREMFLDAREEGIGKYKLTGAYRSVQYQDQLFADKLAEDPAYGSNPYQHPVKVMPGNCTEHATGLALDILAVSYEKSNDDYAKTEEGKWLLEHAHEYGFILRYPKDKEHITGVIYEPWHYRYVGKQAAEEIYEQNVCLEEYLDFK